MHVFVGQGLLLCYYGQTLFYSGKGLAGEVFCWDWGEFKNISLQRNLELKSHDGIVRIVAQQPHIGKTSKILKYVDLKIEIYFSFTDFDERIIWREHICSFKNVYSKD